jgi:hypothetical protein
VPDVEFVCIGLGIGDKFAEIIGGKVFADHKQLRVFGRQSDRLEILLRIVAQIRVERGCQCIGAHVTGEDGVAVGRGVRGTQRTNGAAGAADVFHHDPLAEMTAKNIGDNPAGDICRATGSERNDDCDRS